MQLQVDLGGFAPNVHRDVTAFPLETALMPGGNPAVAATHFVHFTPLKYASFTPWKRAVTGDIRNRGFAA